MRVVFNLGTPTKEGLEAALEALANVDSAILRDDASIPRLYNSGVRYRRERIDTATGKRRDEWENIKQVLAVKCGDCEDLVGWRVAELRVRDNEAARGVVKRTGPSLWHALVQRADGRIEDPSRHLGMGGGNMGGNTPMTRIQFYVRPDGQGGYVGELIMPTIPGAAGPAQLATRAKGKTKANAVQSAAELADQALSNPAIAALLPPGTSTVIKALKLGASSPAAAALYKGAEGAAKGVGKLLGRIF